MSQIPDYKKREIALRDLLYRVFRKWRGILVVAIAVAAAAALWKALPGRGGSDVSSEALSAYEASRAAYETDKESYQAMIDRTKALLTQKRAYLASSLLMQIDPAQVGKASASIIVSVPSGEEMPVSAEQLVDAYAAFCTQGADWSKEAEKLGTELCYISELISTNPSVSTTAAYAGVGDATSYSGQSGRGTLTVTVVHPEVQTAEELLDDLLAQLQEEQERLAGITAPHSIAVAGKSSGYFTDTAIGSRSENLLQELYMLSTNEERLEAQLAKLKKPAKPSAAAGFSVKSLLKWGLIGFAGGFVLAVLLLMVYLSFKGTVLSAGEMCGVFGIPRLGLIPDQIPKKGPIDRLVAKLDSEQKNSGNLSSRYLFAAGALLTNNPCPARIALIGTVSGERLEECAQALKTALLACSDIAADRHHVPEITIASPLRDHPASLTALQSAEGAILVEEIEKSPYSCITEDIQIIRASGTELLGAILL